MPSNLRLTQRLTLACALILTGAALPAAAQDTNLYWGDTHLHTSYSVDAYSTGNTSADPDTAYRFAKGLPVLRPRVRDRVRIDRPLDFLVVADHAVWMRLQDRLANHDPALLSTPSGQRLVEILEGPGSVFGNLNDEQTRQDLFNDKVRRGSWAAEIDAAERHNAPGTFTTLIGWEWTSIREGANLHRVVFTSADGDTAKEFIPYSNMESTDPRDLWNWLDKTSDRTGADFVAIPHNANLSNGMMFAETDLDGQPITAQYARERMRWEGVVEVTQVKGTSEAHPALAPNDEFADFEIYQRLLTGEPTEPQKGDYARSALKRGLKIEGREGVNPYKFGMIGASDSHTGLSSVDESNFYGKLVVDTLPEERVDPSSGPIFPAWGLSASGLAGVWAEENTREAIFRAFKRKEVYATTGPRIRVRMFGGFGFAPQDAEGKDLAAVGYEKGVPMGGDLTDAPDGAAPSLLVRAVKDPEGSNLDRVQVVKGWLDDAGETQSRIYNVAWAGDRTIDADGDLPAIGNTVNTATAGYENSIGTAELATVWTDPDFDPDQRAFYYVRVLQIPTPRHSLVDAVALQIDPAKTEKPTSIQERAYSSPIWYTP